MATLHVWIEGRVQGVFFRDSTRRKAVELGLTGWVRNLPDGRVEAVFQGDEDACMEALAFVSAGPPAAVVKRLEQRWETASKQYDSFEIRF
jgi:acylphosphatase